MKPSIHNLSGLRPVHGRKTATRAASSPALRSFLIGTILLSGSPLLHAQTFFWDGNNDTAGFGDASGTWAAPTAGTLTSGWSTNNAGTAVVNGNSITTTTAQGVGFGNGATGLGAGTITVSGTVAVGAMTFASGSGEIVLSGAGTISGGGGLTLTVNNTTNSISTIMSGTALVKAGTGTMNLSGDNTWSNVLNVNAGTLNFSGSTTSIASTITVKGSGQLGISNGNFTANTWLFAGDTAAAGTINQTGGATTFTNGGTQLALGNNGGTGTYNLSGGSLSTINGTFRGVLVGSHSSGTGTFNLSGTGQLIMSTGSMLSIGRHDLNQTNTTGTFNQTGGTATVGVLSMGGGAAGASGTNAQLNLSAGIFTADSFAALSLGNTSTSTINISGTADVTLPDLPNVRGTSSTATITFDGGTLRTRAGSTTLIGTNTTAQIKDGGAKFNTANGSTTISTLLQNFTGHNGSLTKEGSNTLTLSGKSTYTGTTLVSTGTLEITGTGHLYGASSTATSTVSVASGAQIKLSGASTYYNVLGFGDGHNWIVAGTIDSTGGSAHSLPGNVTLNNGTLAGIGNSLWGTYHVPNNATITANGASNTISAANIGLVLSRTLTLNTPLAGDALTVSSAIGVGSSTVGALTKAGLGTATLSGTNLYTGATAVNAGTLLIGATGSTHASSAVTVSNAGTALVINGTVNGTLNANASTIISGTGTVGGAATISGTLAPGASPGTLTFGNTLGLDSTALTLMEIDGLAGAGVSGGHDFVNLTGVGAAGVLTYGGAMTIDIGTLFGAGSYSWDLFDFASKSGTFATISLDGQYSGSLLDTNLNGIWNLSSGNDSWTFTESTGVLGLTVIPEPSAALLGGIGLLLLLRRRSR